MSELNLAPVQLFFNKANGVLMHHGSQQPLDQMTGLEYYEIVEVQMDLEQQTVVGVYPDYEIKLISDVPEPFYESQADLTMAAKITKKYPVVEQVNILARAILQLAEHHGEALPELQEMLSYIQLCKDTNRSTKEFYRDSPDFVYISNEQADEDFNALFEGGIHEHLGARQIQGGRVFG